MSAAMDAVTAPRKVVKSVLSVAQEDGDGARVHRSIGRPELRSLDPFLMLDEFDVHEPAGFPPHPHRGQSTVTYMLEGAFEHEDFKGHRGIIGPGDLQWMVAGRGIVHSEMPSGKVPGRGLQLWVNLPRSEKMCEPTYQELKGADIPKATVADVTATIIAGTAFGVSSPVRTKTPTSYLDFKMAAGSVLTQAIPAGWNSFVYVLSGSAAFGCADVSGAGTKESGAHQTLVLSNEGSEDGIIIKAGASGCHFVLLAGEPLKEPVVQYGPFVMTSQAEIAEAFDDYRRGRNGFEGAHAFSAEWDRRH